MGSRYEVLGRKFWTWGTARSGGIWENLLTDHSGPYIEIQTGRLPNQSDTWIFEPHGVERWEEFWYPVKGLGGGFVWATAEAALNVRWHGARADLSVNVTRPRRGLVVEIEDGGKTLARVPVGDLDPTRAWSRSVELARRPLRPEIRLVDSAGEELLRYRPVEIGSPIPPPAGEPKPESEMTAEELAARGLELEKAWAPERAEALYRKALAADSGQTLALVRLGLLFYKRGKSDSALICFDRALRRNPESHDARYYRALARLEVGDTTGAQADLWFVARRRPYSHVAPFVLAEIACANANWPEAERLLRRGLRTAPDDYRARALLAAVLRRAGRQDEAREVLRRLLEDDPLNAAARCEAFFLEGSPEARAKLTELLYLPPGIYYRGAEDYLELAWHYADAGLLEEATRVPRLYLETAKEQGRRTYPLALYTLGWLAERLGESSAADSLYRLATTLPPDYVFPHRPKTQRVLRAALRRNPNDWKALYYLGNLLCGRGRWSDGREAYLEAVRVGGNYSVLFRNLGQVDWLKRRDYAIAARWYERAVAASPSDWHLYPDLDRLYSILGRNRERRRLLDSAPPEVQANFNVKLRRAVLALDVGDYDGALDILMHNRFKPWEGWTGAREVYLLAHFRRGLERLSRGDVEGAIQDFRATLLYPENLGTGRPSNPDFARPYYLLGRAFSQAGRMDSARHYFRLAVREEGSPASASGVYKALAWRELGHAERADSLLSAGLTQIERRWAVPERRSYRLAYARGLILRAMGQGDEAERWFRTALQMNPEFRWARWKL